MNSHIARCVALCVAFLLFLQAPLPASACATCGCSEVCALNLFGDSVDSSKTNTLLSNSIWGRLILGIAYNRDPELRKLGRANRFVSSTNSALLAGAGAVTLPQGIASVYTLPDRPDSYAPGNIGLVVEGITNFAIWGRMLINAPLRRKIRSRQAIVRVRVENILYHLQHSEWSCPEAEKELAELIGPKAAEECVNLWQTSHGVASDGAERTTSKADVAPSWVAGATN